MVQAFFDLLYFFFFFFLFFCIYARIFLIVNTNTQKIKDEYNSQNRLNNKNYQTPSQKFKQNVFE